MDSSIINGIRVLKAKDGYVLTQSNINDEEERIYTDMLFLGINDSEENWTEVEAGYLEQDEGQD